METEDDEQLCNNCKRPVSSKNFATHSAFCERNIFVCKICDEPVQITEKNQHLEEYHVIFPCDLCEFPLEKWLLPKHMELCPKRLIKCNYCEAEYSFDEISGHVEFCGSKTEKCLMCQKYVMIKDKANHNELHVHEQKYHTKGIEEEVKQNKFNEVICKNIFEKTSSTKCDDLSFAKGTASRPGSKMREEADTLLPDKSRSKATQENRNSENPTIEGAISSLPIKTKEKSKYYGECHICKQFIPWIDMNVHIPSCASSAGKCSVCGEHVPSHEIKVHMIEHYQNISPKLPLTVPQNDESCFKPNTFTSIDSYATKNKVIREAVKCPYCSLYCTEERILDHSRNCLKNIYECPLCNEKIPEKDKNRHETFDCVMIFERESNRYSFSRSSSQSFYECPLCFENVPEENRDTHVSFDCKTLLNSNKTLDFHIDDPFDTYQCPLCLEDMLMKDKEKHESFECKVLIENNEVQMSGQTYADVAKETCRDNSKCKQKCSEICLVCKNRIPQHKLSEHKKSCQRMKFHCVLCNQLIDAACEDMHSRSCPGLNIDQSYSNHKSKANQTYSTSKHEYKGAIPKSASIKDMVKPQMSKCKHCQTTLNANIVIYHEKECVHRPIECPDCSRSIPEKDFVGHRCKTKKGKGRNSKTMAPEVEKDQPSIKKKIWRFFIHGDEKEEEKYASVDRIDQYPYHSDEVSGNQHLYFSGIDNTLIPCEFCHKIFPASDIVLHETGCQPDLVSYAKPDSSNDSKLSKPGSKEDSGLLPSRSSSVMNDSGPTGKSQISHTSNVNDPFFANTKSFLPTSKFEHIKTKTESNTKPGEFLMSLGDKSASKHYKYSKKVEPFKLHSVWGAKSSNDFKVEDNSNQISDHSDVEMGVEETEESTYSNVKERKSSKVYGEKVSEEIDSEMTTIMDFLSGNKNTEFVKEYENISVVNEKTAVSKSLGTEEYCVLDSDLLSGDIEENQGDFLLLPYRVRKDLPVSKKTTVDEESENMYREFSKSIDNTVQEQKEYVRNFRQHLADFKFNSFKTSSKDSVHHTILPEKSTESEKLCKQKPLRNVDSTKDEDDVRNYKRLLPDFKFDVCESSVDNVFLSEKNDELEKIYKQKTSRIVDSTKAENDVSNYKQLPDFKYNAHESSVDNVHCTILPGKNVEPEKLYKQKISRDVDSAKGEKDVSNYKQLLPDFKFGAHESSENNVNCTILPEKNAEPEKLYKQKTSRYTDSTKDERDFGHLSDFKFDTKETKSLSSENIVLHEKKSGYHDNHAFKLEPVLHVSNRSTVCGKSEKICEIASRFIDDMNKDYEESDAKKVYMSDLKFGTRVTRSLSNEDNVLHTTVSDEKHAFKIEPAEPLLKEAKLDIQMTRDEESKEVNDLDEKIAKLHKRNFIADVENNDTAKWKKWRNRKPSSSSSDSD